MKQGGTVSFADAPEDVLSLAGLTPFASGRDRFVYLDPSDPARLIKVLKSGDDLVPLQGVRRLSSLIPFDVRKSEIRKELDAYRRIAMSAFEHKIRIPIAHMMGFVTTDKGLGQVTEKVATKSGDVAPAMPEILAERRLSAQEIEALNSLAQRLILLDVRASDLAAQNVVFGYRKAQGGETQANLGPFEAVLVDGFADIHAIPIRTWSRWANRKATDSKLSRIARLAGLTWRAETQSFEGE